MRLHPRFPMQAYKVTVITLAYVIIGLFMALYDQSILHSPLSQGPSVDNRIDISIITGMIASTFGGLIGGSALVIINSQYFRKKSFGYALKATLVAYILTFILIAISVALFYAWYSSSNNDQPLIEITKDILYNFSLGTNFIFWGFITLATLFLLQVNDKFGPGILQKFMMGQYYHPKEEQRVFMFLDIKSSTTIAEKIGHKAYFNLLNDFFNDITGPILDCKGEIYQYVGDEVVISWTMQKGKENANCLQCFFLIQERIHKLSDFYLQKYGLVPDFKAGVHYGEVTAGEIGSIKRDIVYSGDVLNTTARIQEQCNHYQVKLLVSKKTLDLFSSPIHFNYQQLGFIELRGRKEKVELNSVNLK